MGSSYTRRQCKALDPKTLIDEARRLADLTDFSDMGIIEPMSHWTDRAAREFEFSEEGLEILRQATIRYLVNRLRAEDDFNRHPEILEEDLSNPIILIGLPRSGTTKMQRMMAANPGVQKTYMWQLINPARFPGEKRGEPTKRMIANMDEAVMEDAAEVQAGHAMGPGNVEEDGLLYEYAMNKTITGYAMHLPVLYYREWGEGSASSENIYEGYRYVRKLVQYLQWQNGGRQGRPWLLKSTMHLAHMGPLSEAYPDATFLHCHRDPVATIPSIAKLMLGMWGPAGHIDKKRLGNDFFNWALASVRRYMETREQLKLDDRIIDVGYETVRGNPLASIQQAYERAGWEYNNEVEQAMLDWEKHNEQGKHGRHTYSLEEFGLDEQQIKESFADYIDRFVNA